MRSIVHARSVTNNCNLLHVLTDHPKEKSQPGPAATPRANARPAPNPDALSPRRPVTKQNARGSPAAHPRPALATRSSVIVLLSENGFHDSEKECTALPSPKLPRNPVKSPPQPAPCRRRQLSPLILNLQDQRDTERPDAAYSRPVSLESVP